MKYAVRSSICVIVAGLMLIAVLFVVGARNWYRHGCLSVQGNSWEFCNLKANEFIWSFLK